MAMGEQRLALIVNILISIVRVFVFVMQMTEGFED
jgi:cytochrome c oxidase subunit IV